MRIFKKYRFSLLISIIMVLQNSLSAQQINCDSFIDLETQYFNGKSHQAGDTICMEAGDRGPLYIGNISGNSDSAVVFINHNGIVNIESEIGYGLSISNCQHIKILGIGSSEEYGIKIQSVTSGTGIKASMLTSDIEIAYTEITNTAYAGIIAKSDPTCYFNSVRDSFTMYNTHIHHNYIHHTGTEGIYIGNSFFGGVYLQSCDTTVLPHILDGVDIHDNIIDYTGWDGIQLGCALYNSKIHHNFISHDSDAEKIYQMSGIMVNPGSACDVYNNTIIDGKGTGIALQGVGGQMIYNNLIVNSGKNYQEDNQTSAQKFGIFCKYMINEGSDSSFVIAQNTIINPKSDGIRFQNTHSSNNKVFNNIIVNPGAYDYYENNGSTSNTGEDSYLYIYFDGIDIDSGFNLFERESSNLKFEDTLNYNYQLTPDSPAINTGKDLSSYGIDFDLNDVARPFFTLYDIGAYEYAGVGTSEIDQSGIQIIPNPFSKFLKFKLQGSSKISSLTISDLTGKLFYSKENIQVDKINVDQLPKGMYLIEILTSDNDKYIHKALKI